MSCTNAQAAGTGNRGTSKAGAATSSRDQGQCCSHTYSCTHRKENLASTGNQTLQFEVVLWVSSEVQLQPLEAGRGLSSLGGASCVSGAGLGSVQSIISS